MKVQVEAKYNMHSHVTGNGGVSGHRLGREVVVAVRAVQERLSPLAVDKIGLQDKAGARAGHRVQGAATWWRAIVHIKTAYGEKMRETKVERLESDHAHMTQTGTVNKKMVILMITDQAKSHWIPEE